MLGAAWRSSGGTTSMFSLTSIRHKNSSNSIRRFEIQIMSHVTAKPRRLRQLPKSHATIYHGDPRTSVFPGTSIYQFIDKPTRDKPCQPVLFMRALSYSCEEQSLNLALPPRTRRLLPISRRHPTVAAPKTRMPQNSLPKNDATASFSKCNGMS